MAGLLPWDSVAAAAAAAAALVYAKNKDYISEAKGQSC
jgi:hypothetical protein